MGALLLSKYNVKDRISRIEFERETCMLKSIAAMCVEDKVSSFDIRGAAEGQWRTAYVDEMIIVRIEVWNPLQCSLQLEDFGLYYEFTAEGEERPTI